MIMKRATFFLHLSVITISLLLLSACEEKGLTCSISVSLDKDGSNPINDGAFITGREPSPFWVYIKVKNNGKAPLPQYKRSNVHIRGTVTNNDILIKLIDMGKEINESGSLTLPPIFIHPDSSHDSIIQIKVEVSPFTEKEIGALEEHPVDFEEIGALQVEVDAPDKNSGESGYYPIEGSSNLHTGNLSFSSTCIFNFEVHSIR